MNNDNINPIIKVGDIEVCDYGEATEVINHKSNTSQIISKDYYKVLGDYFLARADVAEEVH